MRLRLLALVILALCAGQPAATASESPPEQSLAGYLDALNRTGGYRIVYSTDLVTDGLRLRAAVPNSPTVDELRELLAPFGLTAAPGPGDSLLIVAGAAVPETAANAPRPKSPGIPEIVVTSSLHRLQYSSTGSHTYLDQELATRVPTTADDTTRVTHRLPGVSSGGVSARGHIRGGEVNEVLFLFDGLRLYEPYHLKDFQSVATIINSNAIAGIDTYTGAYPARYGDRMSGVMDLGMRESTGKSETEVAFSFFNTSLLSLGTFGDGARGDWLLAARRGNLDIIADVIDPEVGSPDYQDYLAHVGWHFGPRASLTANVLVSDDKLRLFDPDRGEAAAATYSNQVVWLTWDANWSPSWQSRTVVAFSDIKDGRRGTLELPGVVSGSLAERKEFSAAELRHDWEWRAAKNWMLRFGFNLKDLDATYDFTSTKAVSAPFDSILGNSAVTQFDFDLNPGGAQYAAFTELRWRLHDGIVVDLGLRWDQQNYTTSADDKQYSPRASVLLQPGDATDIRLGWGQYYQAQEINELQLSDGGDRFYPAQRAEHFVVELRHVFANDVDLNLSAYRKSFRTLRPRYENAFNALTLLPELQFDRVRIDASGAESIGAELTITKGSSSDDSLWWISYAWSQVTDETPDGDIRRSWDQTHALKFGLSRSRGPWRFSVAGEIHTGWPRTALSGEVVNDPINGPQLALSVTPRNSLRYGTYQSLDVRVSRDFEVRKGTLTGFLEVTNLLNRENGCCDEYALGAGGELIAQDEYWLPLVPSLGVVWRF